MDRQSWKYLSEINNPADLKKIDESLLPDVCDELREFIMPFLSILLISERALALLSLP